MNLPKLRQRYQPRVVGPEGRDHVIDTFRAEAKQWRLQWRCDDCAYQSPSNRTCSLKWPNQMLLPDDPDVLDAADVPIFCKAFESSSD
ncbi:MAG: hypothetical protein KC502_03485 [Myxococcales bacterium]|nr:hypothetical protein [Myxococcales bacterium]